MLHKDIDGLKTSAKIAAELVNPTQLPTVTKRPNATSQLPAGDYSVLYTFKNAFGETLKSPSQIITIQANEELSITTPDILPNASHINIYVGRTLGTEKFHTSTRGGKVIINTLATGKVPPTENVAREWVTPISIVGGGEEELLSKNAPAYVREVGTTIKAAFEGESDVKKVFPEHMTAVCLSNDGTRDLFLTVNDITLRIKEGEVFQGTFDFFKEMQIEGTSTFRCNVMK